MKRVAPYAVEVIDATPAEVVEITTRIQAAYRAPVVVRHRTSDRVLRNRVRAAGVALVLSALVGLNGPLWSAMPWAVSP